ncbi:MAG TPA: rod shape-determining protein MreC [Verrucomicrobiae bacterium]|jgi:rod shape-determining protein MreC|nr:rod shape-determining protein MreC [Verrucomicrobiae bacterium]
MLKRPHWIGLIIAVLLAILLLNLPSNAASRLKAAVSSLFFPLFGLANSAQKLGDSAGIRAIPKGTLITELQTLRHENEELKIQVMQAQETARENDMLREAVAWQKKLPWNKRLARVIGRDPANWWRTIQIDLGKNAGVTKDMPVITPDGLVGKVQEAGASTSRVVLLGDPQCKVGAVVDNPGGRDTGIVGPGEASVLDESILEMTFLPRHSQAVPGQKVFTSGLGGVFPKNILIGQITQTNSIGYGLYLEARVKLSANLRDLEEVWVIYP